MKLITYVSRQAGNILKSPLFFVFLSFIYPSVYLIELNSHIYTPQQIVFTFLFIFLFSVAATLLTGGLASLFARISVYFEKKFISKEASARKGTSFRRAFLGAAGTLYLLILLHSANRELLPMIHNVLWLPVYAVLALLMGALACRFQLRLFNIILVVLVGMNGLLWAVHGAGTDAIRPASITADKEILFQNKPNIYLVILESYASLEMREKIYGIDNGPLKKELLRGGYTIYKTYSNYPSSLESVSSIFLMKHHYFKPSRGVADGAYRGIIGGDPNNAVLPVLLKNGYWIDYSSFHPYFYHSSPSVQPGGPPFWSLSCYLIGR
jgi:hypothetical protein